MKNHSIRSLSDPQGIGIHNEVKDDVIHLHLNIKLSGEILSTQSTVYYFWIICYIPFSFICNFSLVNRQSLVRNMLG